MKRSFVFAAVAALLVGCVSKPKVVSVPQPPEQNFERPSRTVAASFAEAKFKEYFSDGNCLVRFKKMNNVAKQLLANMPDKGNAKKRLVKQFVSDLDRIERQLSQDPAVVADTANTWLPPKNANYAANVKLLGAALQSSNMMDRMGIYLTSSGVMESDTMGEDFYYTMLAQATAQIDSELRNLMLVYPPEQKDADENQARLGYVKTLAADMRTNIRRSFQSNKAINVKSIDQLLKDLGNSKTLQDAARLKVTPAYKYTAQTMSGLHIMNSSDVDGFKDDVELTLATKFSFEMINELISSVR